MRSLFAIFLLLGLTGCGGADKSVNVPRPYAWPRVETYPDSFAPIAGLPVRWMANAAAQTSLRSGGRRAVWADVRYPAYGATLFLTVVSPEPSAADSIIANRRQRIAVNLGDTPATQEEIVSADGEFTSELITATAVTPSPLQFISRGDRRIVTGTVFFDRAPAAYDSVRPIVDALRSDMVFALKSLKNEADF